MIAKSVAAFCAAALASGVLAAAQPAPAPAPAANSNNERLICRTMPDGGSRFTTQRACHTRAEWAELRRQTQQTIDHIQMMSATASAH